MMQSNKDANTYGCPLRDQTGPEAIKNFETIVARLSPDQRALFEAERADLEADYHEYVLVHGYNS